MSQDQAQNQQDHQPANPPPTPGAILAAHRQEVGLTLADVSNKLKLSKRQVEALEADDYEALPGNTFVRGFVRNYARLLEIDAQPLIHFLDSHLPKETSQAALPRLRDEALPVLRPSGKSSGSPFILAVCAGVAMVLVGAGGYWLYEKNRQFEPELTVNQPQMPVPVAVVAPAMTETPSPDAAPSQPPATDLAVVPTNVEAAPVQAPPANMPGNPPVVASAATAAVVAAQASQTALPSPVPSVPAPTINQPVAVPAATGDLRVVAKQDSWVQITDAAGRRLVNELLSAGETRSVAGTPPYKVRIGNGRHTELFYKGKPTDLAPFIKVDVANLELN